MAAPMVGVDTLCRAPALNLYFRATGEVGACCRNSRPYGNVRTRRLPDLWSDAWRTHLRDELGAGRFPDGCERCAVETELLDRDAVYAADYDRWAQRLAAPDDMPWPIRMEFNLSNRCNLACVQCDGDLSSTIRRTREKRPPLAPAYDDQFFADLEPFLAHLRHASFAGGEPFLARENRRVWDALRIHRPGLAITVVTNGTVWNQEVERLLEDFRVEPVVSIDGYAAGVLESIRIGVDRDLVFTNLLRFAEASRSHGTACSINACVMPQNLLDLVDLVGFAEDEGIVVNPLIVHGPASSSLAQLPRLELQDLSERFDRAVDQAQPRMQVNARFLPTIQAQVHAWLAGDQAAPETTWTINAPSILQFRRRGHGPVAVEPVADQLGQWSHGAVHDVAIGPDERARGWTPELAALLGMGVDRLEGAPIAVILEAAERYEVLEQDEDRFLAEVAVRGLEGRVALVPERGADGRCDVVHALLAFRAPAGHLTGPGD